MQFPSTRRPVISNSTPINHNSVYQGKELEPDLPTIHPNDMTSPDLLLCGASLEVCMYRVGDEMTCSE
jgi:hypothetical protein